MKKLLFLLLLTQSVYINAQVETFVTPNGKKVQIDTTPYWYLDGNSNNAEKSIGTKNANDLPVITNNNEAMRVTADGKVLIHTPTPLSGGANAKVQINGSIQIADGTQGKDKVLISDANGVATWKASAVNNKIYEIDLYPAHVLLPIYGTEHIQTGSSFDVPVSGIYNVFADFNLPPGYMISVGNNEYGYDFDNTFHYSQSRERFYQNTPIYLEKGKGSIKIYNDSAGSDKIGGDYWHFIVSGPLN